MNTSQIANEITKDNFHLSTKSIPQSYKDLIIKCWSKNLNDRLTFDAICDKLKTDEGFIIEGVDREAYHKYVESIDEQLL